MPSPNLLAVWIQIQISLLVQGAHAGLKHDNFLNLIISYIYDMVWTCLNSSFEWQVLKQDGHKLSSWFKLLFCFFLHLIGSWRSVLDIVSKTVPLVREPRIARRHHCCMHCSWCFRIRTSCIRIIRPWESSVRDIAVTSRHHLEDCC